MVITLSVLQIEIEIKVIKINKNKNCVLTDNNGNENGYLNSNNIVQVSSNELLNYALHYAKIGYPVLPLHYIVISPNFRRCSCSAWKVCDKPGKHPRTWHGHKDATTDENQILKWWTNCPNANIGVVTGIKAGIFVLDIDVNHSGENSFEDIKDYYRHKLRDEYDCEATLIAYSGSGGRHLIYKHPIQFEIKSSESMIDLGLDIKGEESYIVAAPSNHWSKRKYFWHGINTAITEAPNWLIYEILKSKNKLMLENSDESNAAVSERISNGERNSYLSAQARGLVNSYSERAGSEILMKKNKERFVEPLAEQEVERIIRKTWKKYGNNQNREIGLNK